MSTDSKIQRFRDIINHSENIVFFGGAGTSTESNIPDFRTPDTGIYNAKTKYPYPPEVMISHDFFMQHTKEFYEFYLDRMVYKEAKPNAAHIALAELESQGRLKAVITQNIDGLHQMAGSENVLELHGSIYRNYCMECHKFFELDYIINSKGAVPKCDKCGGIVKPDVVLYQESLDMDIIKKSVDYISNADVLIVGGTSLVVYPAAGLIEYYRGNKLILINKSVTGYDNMADLMINDSIGQVLSSALKI